MIYHQFFDTFVSTMAKEVKPEINSEILGNNPFAETLVVRVNKMTMNGQYTADKDGLMLPVEIELEKDSYCKVYLDSGRRLKMVGLSPRGKDLLLWIIYEVENGEEYIWINKVRYMKEAGVKAYNTYKEAVNELVRNGFLQISVMQNVYWINPHFFFNGSRIKAFPKNVKIK